MKHPVFITGNQDKADYLNHVLGIELEHQKLSLDDKIFKPMGYNGLTVAELSPEESWELHNNIAGFKALRDFLLSN